MLNFYNCIRLLDEATKSGLIQRDPNNHNNILVYRDAGETDPEGWYSDNLMKVAQDLVHDPDGQEYILRELQEKTGQPFQKKKLPFTEEVRKEDAIRKSTLRENLLVTFGARAAYMDAKGIICLPAGSDGEDKLADFAVAVVDNYMSQPDNGDVGFDEFIETALSNKFGLDT